MKDELPDQYDPQTSVSCEAAVSCEGVSCEGHEVSDSEISSGGCVLTREPSELSRDLAQIKQSVVGIAKTREHLPQPLFWSLFHIRIQRIKRKKILQRVQRSLLFPS